MPKVDRRFTLLRLIVVILLVVSILIIIGGIVLGILSGAFAIGAAALLSGLVLIAFAQLIQVRLAHEESARITNALLLRLFRRRE